MAAPPPRQSSVVEEPINRGGGGPAPQYYYPAQYQMPPTGAGPGYPPHMYGQQYQYPSYGMPIYYPPPPQGFNGADQVASGYYIPQGYAAGEPYYDPQLQQGMQQQGMQQQGMLPPPAYGTQSAMPPNLIPVRLPQNAADLTFQRHPSPQPNQQSYEYAMPQQHAPLQHRASVASDRASVISMATPPGHGTPSMQRVSSSEINGAPQPRPSSGQHGSHSNGSSTYEDSQGYLPVIPASPLTLQQQSIAKTISSAEATLAKAIQERQDLSTIRRLTENVNVGRNKLDAVGKMIRDAQSKLTTDIPPKDMAVAITAFDSDMLEFIRPTDLASNASDPNHPPYPIKSSLDFGYYIRRLVQITCVVPAIQTSRVRAIIHWIDVAKELQKLRNFQSYGAVVSGLKSQCVQALYATWIAIPRKYQQVWHELRHNMSSDDSFKVYRSMLSASRPPCIPRLDIFLHALAAPGGLEPGKKEFEYYRSKTYGSEFENRDMGVQHWLVVQNWKSEEQLNELSSKQEPPPKDAKSQVEKDKKEREEWLKRLTRAGEVNDD